jgi:hypothetical protein
LQAAQQFSDSLVEVEKTVNTGVNRNLTVNTGVNKNLTNNLPKQSLPIATANVNLTHKQMLAQHHLKPFALSNFASAYQSNMAQFHETVPSPKNQIQPKIQPEIQPEMQPAQPENTGTNDNTNDNTEGTNDINDKPNNYSVQNLSFSGHLEKDMQRGNFVSA